MVSIVWPVRTEEQKHLLWCPCVAGMHPGKLNRLLPYINTHKYIQSHGAKTPRDSFCLLWTAFFFFIYMPASSIFLRPHSISFLSTATTSIYYYYYSSLHHVVSSPRRRIVSSTRPVVHPRQSVNHADSSSPVILPPEASILPSRRRCSTNNHHLRSPLEARSVAVSPLGQYNLVTGWTEEEDRTE